ncbi:MAG TPA: hypothetical protein VHV79_10340 [Mycobacteriales bacterium]|nr:hypothetical protein [Mycobacteriales bacterium]
MTTGSGSDPRRRVSAALAALSTASIAAFAGPATAAPTSRAAHSPACAQAMHRFVEADRATVSGSVVKVSAHKARFHCGGEDDGHYTTAKATETLRVSKKAIIRVFKSAENPSNSRTIKATALPHWLKKNSSEPIYRIAGPKHKVTRMTEQFHP